jgi:hypothetical protein
LTQQSATAATPQPEADLRRVPVKSRRVAAFTNEPCRAVGWVDHRSGLCSWPRRTRPRPSPRPPRNMRARRDCLGDCVANAMASGRLATCSKQRSNSGLIPSDETKTFLEFGRLLVSSTPSTFVFCNSIGQYVAATNASQQTFFVMEPTGGSPCGPSSRHDGRAPERGGKAKRRRDKYNSAICVARPRNVSEWRMNKVACTYPVIWNNQTRRSSEQKRRTKPNRPLR